MAAPTNSLETYRKKATFNIEALRLFIYGDEFLEHRYRLWDTLSADPLFAPPIGTPSPEEHQKRCFLQTKRLTEYDFTFFQSPRAQAAFLHCLTAMDLSLALLYGLNLRVGAYK